jgi:hypothetical protein
MNIPWADAPFEQLTGSVLTITDQKTNITDTIKIAGPIPTGLGENSAPDGFTQLSFFDPPMASTHLLVQAMASFGSQSGIAETHAGNLADNVKSQDFLAASSQVHHSG